MTLSLRTKLVAAFVLMGLIVLIVSSLVYYFSFERLAYKKMKTELFENALEFSKTIVVEASAVSVRDDYEWQDADEEYVAAADAQFRTLKKSENMGSLELQAWCDFQPVSTPQIAYFSIDETRMMCAVLPVEQNHTVVAYILVAASMAKLHEYTGILMESILISLLFLALFGVGSAYVLANRMVYPVWSIQQAVGKMDLDSLDRRIELVQADSEAQSLVETLNDLFDRLEKSYREINHFSAQVAHELLTPLTILRGNIEVALTREREKDAYVEILSDLLEETLHIIHVVDSLLLLAHGDTASLSFDKKPVDFAQFCDEQSRDWEAICSLKDQPMTFQVEGFCTITGDPNLLAQLFLNLVSNASKYSGPGQPVEIRIRKQTDAFNGTNGVLITVKDEGDGIPDGEQKKVFERFYRVQKDRSRETGGTGLGLSICQMITSLHGGKISLTSSADMGTIVTILLPIGGDADTPEKLKSGPVLMQPIAL